MTKIFADASSSAEISGLKFLDPHTFVTCSKTTGDLWVTDIRQKAATSLHMPGSDNGTTHDAPHNTASWVMDLCSLCNGDSDSRFIKDQNIIRLSSSGIIHAFNIQKPGDVLWSHELSLQAMDKDPDIGIQVCTSFMLLPAYMYTVKTEIFVG